MHSRQTGIMIAGSGIAIDRVISDFASGAAEQLVVENGDAQLLFVEGQGGINHPAFAPVTLALLFGSAPDALVLVHRAGRTHIEDYSTPLLGYRALIRTYEALCATVKPARVAGIALNTSALDEEEARHAIERARTETGLPADHVVRFGPHALYGAMASSLAHEDDELVRAAAALLVLVLACGLGACTKVAGDGTETAADPGHLWIGSPDEPDNINPMFAHTDATIKSTRRSSRGLP